VSTPYEKMKAFQAQMNEGVRRGERFTLEGERGILAMARKNDPFYVGQSWQLAPAGWFAALYERLGLESSRVHIRYIHYVASGEEPHPITGEKLQERLPDGTLYENTEENWVFIQEASKFARNLGWVDPRRIVDRRTPRPYRYAPEDAPPLPDVAVDDPTLTLPSIDVADLYAMRTPGSAHPTGYHYAISREPSLIELWIEKSLDDMDAPMIEDICREEGVNLVTGIGFLTISTAYALLERQKSVDKPVRVLHMTDFDPAGSHMPVSPARHVEFALSKMAPEERPDVRVHHLALTAEQVRELGLPRIPIKESDRRKTNFERKYGAGATELNALMQPHRRSETEEMIRDAIHALRDQGLRTKLVRASSQASQMLRQRVDEKLYWPRLALEMIEEQAEAIGERYADQLRGIADRLADEMAPLEERAERVLQVARQRLHSVADEVELPEVEAEEGDEATDGWLFDSRRDYFEQLRYYKER
jgi:hypothetical protein